MKVEKFRRFTKITAVLAAAAIMTAALAGCGSKQTADKSLSKIQTDESAKSVTITATTQGKFTDKDTMHCVVFNDGKMASHSMFVTGCTPEKFHEALVKVGGTPWNTTDKELKDGEYTDGQKVNVTLTWKGQEEPVELGDILVTNGGKHPDTDIRFSGNKENIDKAGSGCILCLNSCWAGITSNASYAFNDIDSGKVKMKLDKDNAPDDNQKVKITFTLE